MPVSIFNFLNRDSDFYIMPDKKSCSPSYNGDKPIMGEIIPGSYTLFSEQKKAFLQIPNSLYHAMHDMLPTLLWLYEIDSSTKFIIDTSQSRSPDYNKSIHDFILMIMEDCGMDFELVDIAGIEVNGESGLQKFINIDNFYYKKHRSIDHAAHNILDKYLHKYIKNKNSEPSKKVYLSRSLTNSDKGMQQNIDSLDNDLVKKLQNNKFTRNFIERIDDEISLENFFRESGFEIVIPENFIALEDQINYFYNVKTLVGISGSGLANALFMQNNTNMVELVTTMMSMLVDPETNELDYQEYHGHFYSAIAFQKDQNYFGISNKSGIFKNLKNKIINDKHLKAIME